MNSRAVTIKELSMLSGFSISTVSKALNNKQDIGKKTRETIQNMAKLHNYVPNNYAVSLRIRKTGAIAIILPEVTKKCYSQALCDIQKSAEKEGFKVLFYQSFGSQEKEQQYLKSLNDGSIDGIILISNSESTISRFKNQNAVPVEFLQINEKLKLDKIKELSSQSLKRLVA